MTVKTGVVGQITVSGTLLSGSESAGAEATVIIGKEMGKFNPVGTDVSEHTAGMKTVEGTIRKKWLSGDTLLQELLDGDIEFEVQIAISGEADITASGCRIGPITRRVAPGTEVMMEEAPFTGRDWY